MGILFAILASLSWGLSGILARLAVGSIGTLAGTFISLVASLAVIAGAVLVFQPGSFLVLTLSAVLWFAFIGVVSYLPGRYSQYKGIELIGASRAVALSAVGPLFAMVVAVIFLKEAVTMPILVGILCIVAGAYLIARRT